MHRLNAALFFYFFFGGGALSNRLLDFFFLPALRIHFTTTPVAPMRQKLDFFFLIKAATQFFPFGLFVVKKLKAFGLEGIKRSVFLGILAAC